MLRHIYQTVLVALCCCALGIQAASITWSTRALITGDADVSTNGGLLYAYDDSNISATVNTVNFAAGNSASTFGGNITISGYYWYNTTAFGSMTGTPWDNLNTNYQSVLQGGVYASSGNTMSVTLSNLTVGHPYLLQVWVCDTRIGASNRTETVTSSGGNTLTLDYNNTSTNGGVGQYAIGTFTADAPTQVFTMTGAQPATGNSAQLNAIQVRDTSVASGSVIASITLNPTTTYQTIYGIGGNLAGGEQLALFNASTGLLTSAFSPSGLNLSFLRIDNPYGQTEPAFNGLTNVNNVVISAFRALQPNGKIMMTSWSPPGSLKSTGSAFEGTLAKNAQGNFVYTNFANWWVNSLKYWQSNSSLPDFVSIQNEPDWYPTSGTNNAWQAGCELTATAGTYAGYNQAFAVVTNAFLANGFGSMKMIGPDTSGMSGNIIPNYLNNLPAGSISVSHHPYGNNISTTGSGLLTTLDSQYPWATNVKFMDEYDGDNWGTNYPGWMGLAVTMHNVFTLENANAYLIWSIYYGCFYNANGSPATDEYYTVGHFSKFVNPGDRRANVTSTDPNLLASFYRRTNSNPAIADVLVMVLINNDSISVSASVGTSNYWAADPLQRSWQVYQTANVGSGERLTLVTNVIGARLTNNQTMLLPPYSITTAVINTGIYTNAPPVFTSTASNTSLNPGQVLVMTNTASDPNQPVQTLNYSLPIGPAGAMVNSANGILNWRPLIAQANTTNAFRVVVADNGSPSLTATQNFTVTVRPVTIPVAASVAMTNGQFQMLINGAVGPDYTLQASINLVTWTNLFTTNPAVLPFNWSDAAATNSNQRFYRVQLGP